MNSGRFFGLLLLFVFVNIKYLVWFVVFEGVMVGNYCGYDGLLVYDVFVNSYVDMNDYEDYDLLYI